MDVAACVKKVLVDLDEGILEYVCSMIEENPSQSAEEMAEAVGPFLESAGFVDDADDALPHCKKIVAELAQDKKGDKGRKGHGGSTNTKPHNSSTAALDGEPRKLDTAVNLGALMRKDEESIDTAMTDGMWGLDNVREQFNTEELVKHRSGQSQRQQRKAAKKAILDEAREKAAAAEDAAWEDERFMADEAEHGGDHDVNVGPFTMNFRGNDLLVDAKLKLSAGRRYGLVGKNGTGKTTLLRHMARYEIEGFPTTLKMFLVDQEASSKLQLSGDQTVVQTVLQADYELLTLQREAEEVQERQRAREEALLRQAEKKQEEERVAAVTEEFKVSAMVADNELAGTGTEAASIAAPAAAETTTSVVAVPPTMPDTHVSVAPPVNSASFEGDEIKGTNGGAPAPAPPRRRIQRRARGTLKAAAGKFRSRKEPKQRRKRREPEISEEERALRNLLEDGAAEADATRLEEVYSRLDEIEVDKAESRVRQILTGLQFTPEMQDGRASALSGGWRMRVALACALFDEPEMLLLDEPTNHLDLEANIWLEDYLTNVFDRTLLIVSHDRTFLNSVVTDIIHLHNRQLVSFKGDFENFERRHREEAAQYRKEYEANFKRRKEMQDFIDKFRANAKRAALVQSRIKALAKMPELEPPVDDKVFEFTFPPAESLRRPVLAVNDVSFRYSKDLPFLFQNVNVGYDCESRVGILGPNGAGKSTFLNLLLNAKGLEPVKGDVFRNRKLKIAAFTQHHVDQLELSKSPLMNMVNAFPDEPQEDDEHLKFRRHLGYFGVSGSMALRPCRQLSGGQKSRVALAIITWQLPHIIIMDEPTNHLDMETIDALIGATQNFQGGMIVVSHDVHFLGSICKELWVVGDGKIERFEGTVEDYKKKVVKAVTAAKR